MIRLLARILLSALCVYLLFPIIPGIHFDGNFLHAVALAVVFGIMFWIVDVVAIALSALITVSTLGLALLWLIPVWLLGFWLLPAVALIMVSNFMPSVLTLSSGWAAIIGGIVMLVISLTTSETTRLWTKPA